MYMLPREDEMLTFGQYRDIMHMHGVKDNHWSRVRFSLAANVKLVGQKYDSDKVMGYLEEFKTLPIVYAMQYAFFFSDLAQKMLNFIQMSSPERAAEARAILN
jgi:hypothetical protein